MPPTTLVTTPKVVVTKEDQVHIDARDARVKAVKDAIEAAKVIRNTKETAGVMETPGAKLDREAKEAKDLKEASVLNKIESFSLAGKGDIELNLIASKVNEIITYLNR